MNRVIQRVFITDAVLVTSLGPTLEQTWQRLVAGQSGIGRVTRFDTCNYVSDRAACIPDLDADESGSLLPGLVDKVLEQIVDKAVDKKVDNKGVDKGVDKGGQLGKDSLLFTATTKSCIDLLNLPPGLNGSNAPNGSVAPTDLVHSAGSVHLIGSKGNLSAISRGAPQGLLGSSMARYISDKLGLMDRGINISAACASSTIAIAKASQALALGLAPSALVCSMDLVSEFVFSGFSALGAMSRESASPFDQNRSGLTLGEGGAALVLTNETGVKEGGLTPMAEISGWGIAGDASHVTAPSRNGSGLVLAIRKALENSGTPLLKIGAINAHGTGTVYNDAMELVAFKRVFGDNVPLINSVKGALGHTLGPAGAIEAALGIKMLEHGVLCPTVGLRTPEKGAETLVSNQPMEFKADFLLTTNSGFGGINAALVLGRVGAL